MIRLGLTGYPLEHSLSPQLHQAALNAAGLSGSYLLYPVPPGDTAGLRNLVGCLRRNELVGLNVTIPHKQAILPFLDGLTPAARAIGAVNTLYLRDGGVLGDNTDAAGFRADLRTLLSFPRSSIILGAGGAARAVVHALWSSGCRVAVAARRLDQARELAGWYPDVRAIELSPPAMQNISAELIVNASPAGMYPDMDASPWPEGLPFPKNAALYDLIYNPAPTRLVKEARAAGLRAMGGLGMLVEQAALAFELWTGFNTPREPLLEAVTRAAS